MFLFKFIYIYTMLLGTAEARKYCVCVWGGGLTNLSSGYKVKLSLAAKIIIQCYTY